MDKKKLLICGGTGFIGKNMIEHFSKDPKYDVTATAFTSDTFDAKDVKWVRRDLTNKDDINDIVSGKDIIIQMAATTSGAKDIVERPQIHVTDNAVMNSLLLSSAFENSTPHFIFPSCTVMYQPSETALKETDFDKNVPLFPNYFGVGNTKVYIEQMCDFFSRQGRTKHTVLRHSNIYGPHDKFDLERSHVFGATMTKVMDSTNGEVEIWGTGKERRDLLYVADLIDFTERAINNQTEPFGLYNVGLGEAVSINGLVKKIIGASGKDLKMVHNTSRPSIPTSLYLDTSKAYNELGWKPTTSLDEGIRKTMDWYSKNIKN